VKRTLRLRRETLTELTDAELDAIVAAGGGPEPTPPVYALTKYCPTNYCVPLTYYCE
jgi:hypothetical protein